MLAGVILEVRDEINEKFNIDKEGDWSDRERWRRMIVD